MKHKIMLILVAFAFVVVCDSAWSQTYTITDLGPLSPAAINTWGQVVGTVNDHAVIWTKFGGRRDLGLLPGGTFSRATAINDLGVVAGIADGDGIVHGAYGDMSCTELTQPFVWTQRSGMQPLGTVEVFDAVPCISFYATGINDFGEVVGFNGEGLGTTFQHGFSWTKSAGMSLFGSGWPPTLANAVSSTGQIVGQDPVIPFFYLQYFAHAVSWKDGVTTDLGVLAKETDPDYWGYVSSAYGVNDLGQVVGWASTSVLTNTSFHAALWTRTGEIRDLGTLPGMQSSIAVKINPFGQIIGSSGNTVKWQIESEPGGPIQVVGRPFIWSEHNGMRDLNTLISVRSGWVLNSATGINVWGQIVGEGTLNGQPHGFLLTPRTFFGF